MIVQLVSVVTGSCGLTLMLTGHQTAMLRITVICGVVTILGSIWAAPRYGIEGVAVAALSGVTLQNVLTLVTARRKAKIWTHVDLTLILNARKILRSALK